MPIIEEVKFKFLKEVKNTSTGKSTWQNVGTSSPINIEDVSITTQSDKLVIADGKEPEIIPFGVKGEGGRTATITGTFKGKSLDGPLMDEYFEVLQDDPKLLGRGLTITGYNATSLLPELSNKKWRIEQFIWDRQARQLGQWRFNIQLGYIWEDPQELRIFASGVGTSQPDNVKFSVVEGYSPSNYGAGTQVFGVKIDTMIEDLNVAKFKTITKVFSKEDIIHVYCETQKSKAVFFGVIKEVIKDSNGAVQYNCVEIGTLLQQYPCAKISSGLFKPKIKIPNPINKRYRTVSEMVGIIMGLYPNGVQYQPGKGIDRTQTWGAKDVIPGKETKLPAQVLSGMTILSALDNFVIKQCNMRTWFDNDTGKLEYGFIRNEITIDPTKEYIISSSKERNQAMDYTVDLIVLYDNNGYKAWYPRDTDLSGKKCASFKIDTVFGDLQLQTMAEKIYTDAQLNHDMFSVVFPAGTVRFQDGDVFVGLGDFTSNPKMGWRGGSDIDPLTYPDDTVWQIKKMTITESFTECLVGASFYSVFDIYRNALKQISETPIGTESKDIETNEIVVTTIGV